MSDFLAALADDERVAAEATPGPWDARGVVYGPPESGWGEPTDFEVWTRDGRCVVEHYMYEGGGTDRENGEHIARWDPARALAVIAALRRIARIADGLESSANPDGSADGSEIKRVLAGIYEVADDH